MKIDASEVHLRSAMCLRVKGNVADVAHAVYFRSDRHVRFAYGLYVKEDIGGGGRGGDDAAR